MTLYALAIILAIAAVVFFALMIVSALAENGYTAGFFFVAMVVSVVFSIISINSYSIHHDKIFQEHCTAHGGHVIPNAAERLCIVGKVINV